MIKMNLPNNTPINDHTLLEAINRRLDLKFRAPGFYRISFPTEIGSNMFRTGNHWNILGHGFNLQDVLFSFSYSFNEHLFVEMKDVECRTRMLVDKFFVDFEAQLISRMYKTVRKALYDPSTDNTNILGAPCPFIISWDSSMRPSLLSTTYTYILHGILIPNGDTINHYKYLCEDCPSVLQCMFDRITVSPCVLVEQFLRGGLKK
jgi:hypothetical protein